jgi:hypothetical protein
VELLVQGQPVRSVIASRFREDLRERGIGDGYHAFTLILPPAILTPRRAHAAVRDTTTGKVFWQINALTFEANGRLTDAISDLRRTVIELSTDIGGLEGARNAITVARALRATAIRLRKGPGVNP